METLHPRPVPWTFPQKLLFRFFVLYFILNLFPFPLNIFPDESWSDALPYTLWGIPVQWIATHLLHLPGTLRMEVTGSGDTMFNWILQGLFLVLSLLGTVLWSVLDRKRPGYDRLHAYMRVYFRYFLVAMMFIYGFAKVFYLQMPPPGLNTLAKPYGTFSPMAVLWSFIGASEPYSIFTGVTELLGGILLVFRRTTLLGALVTFMVMLHVFVLNMCYDVPVKIFSFQLTLLAAFLALPDARGLLDFFLRRKNAAPHGDAPLPVQARWPRISLLLKWAFVGCLLYINLSYCLEARKSYGKYAPRPVLSGIYDVQSFEKNSVNIPLNWQDSTLWRKLIVLDLRPDAAQLIMANDSIQRCVFKPDTLSHLITMNFRKDTTTWRFTYFQPAPDALVLAGVWKNDSLRVQLKRYDERKFLLTNRGFHWVNEVPFNR